MIINNLKALPAYVTKHFSLAYKHNTHTLLCMRGLGKKPNTEVANMRDGDFQTLAVLVCLRK